MEFNEHGEPDLTPAQLKRLKIAERRLPEALIRAILCYWSFDVHLDKEGFDKRYAELRQGFPAFLKRVRQLIADELHEVDAANAYLNLVINEAETDPLGFSKSDKCNMFMLGFEVAGLLASYGFERTKGDNEQVEQLRIAVRKQEDDRRRQQKLASIARFDQLEKDMASVRKIWDQENAMGASPTNVDIAVATFINRQNKRNPEGIQLPGSTRTILRYRTANWSAEEYMARENSRRPKPKDDGTEYDAT